MQADSYTGKGRPNTRRSLWAEAGRRRSGGRGWGEVTGDEKRWLVELESTGAAMDGVQAWWDATMVVLGAGIRRGEYEQGGAAPCSGKTAAANLAYACFDCNRIKGSNISSLDPDTGMLTRTILEPNSGQSIFAGVAPLSNRSPRLVARRCSSFV